MTDTILDPYSRAVGILDNTRRSYIPEDDTPSRLFEEKSPVAVLSRTKDILDTYAANQTEWHPHILWLVLVRAAGNELTLQRVFGVIRASMTGRVDRSAYARTLDEARDSIQFALQIALQQEMGVATRSQPA